MEVEILLKKDNNVIGRVEYTVLITFESATPNRSAIREAVKGKIGANPDLMVVKKVIPLAGRKAIKVCVNVYNDKETMERVEPIYVLKRNGLVEAKASEEKKE